MRKNLIAMSVATLVAGLGLAGGAAANVLLDDGATTTPSNATAQSVIAGGIGHQLIVPYYNVQSGNTTLFNIVNTDTLNGKALKVRFRGASNSDDVFDFQLFLSPGDVWAANISRGADGRATLITRDTSCTLPNGVGSGAGSPFVTARLPASFTEDNKAAQTREGYIEVFNMADIPGNLPTAAGAEGGPSPLFAAIKHVNGTPPGCASAAMNALFSNPTTIAQARALGFRSPSTGLFANFTIINVAKGGAATGEATAIAAVLAGPLGQQISGRGNIVFFPQISGGAPTPDLYTADPALRTVAGGATGVQNGAGGAYTGGSVPIIAASMFDLPDLSTPYLSNQFVGGVLTAASPIQQAEALTRSLAVLNVINEYITDPTIAGFTDWVFSMPVRRYSVALDYRVSPATGAHRAFTKFVNRDYFTAVNTAVSNTQICVGTDGITYYDREERTAVGAGFVISPNPPQPGFALCGETSVLTFNSPIASVLGAEISRTNFSTGSFTDGWANVATPGVNTGAGALPLGPDLAAVGNGLPILGKAYIRAERTGSTSFGASWEHRYNRPFNP
jgi:hypothetical protein